jgi:hypothetical protein
MTKPLELKSPDNAQALAVYLLAAVLGASFAVGSSKSPGMAALLGGWSNGWGLAMLLAGCAGFTSAVLCPRASRPARWLKAEQVACAVLAVLWATYCFATQVVPGATIVGLILFGIMAIASGWRSAQIVVELIRLRQASAQVVTVTVVADPRDGSAFTHDV